jgi:hypothetical protein
MKLVRLFVVGDMVFSVWAGNDCGSAGWQLLQQLLEGRWLVHCPHSPSGGLRAQRSSQKELWGDNMWG